MCARCGVREAECVRAIAKMVGIQNPTQDKSMVSKLLLHNTAPPPPQQQQQPAGEGSGAQQPSGGGKRPWRGRRFDTMGSLVVQALFRYEEKPARAVLDSFGSLEADFVVRLACAAVP